MGTPDTGQALRCAAHPGTETYLRCAQCGTPICPRCLVMTPVGAKCRQCSRARLAPGFRVSPLDLLIAAVVGLVAAVGLGLVGSVLVRVVPLLIMLFPFGVALLVAAALNRVTRRKHHVAFKVIAALAVVVSFLILGLGDFVLLGPLDLMQSGMLPLLLRNVLVGLIFNPFNVLFLVLGVWVAIYRVE
jgi:hypothetical protein